MAKVTKSFQFSGKLFVPGDEIDLNALESDDKADLVSRGVFDADKPAKVKADKPAKEAPAE